MCGLRSQLLTKAWDLRTEVISLDAVSFSLNFFFVCTL